MDTNKKPAAYVKEFITAVNDWEKKMSDPTAFQGAMIGLLTGMVGVMSDIKPPEYTIKFLNLLLNKIPACDQRYIGLLMMVHGMLRIYKDKQKG